MSSPSSSCRVHSAIQALAKDRDSRGSLPESIPPGATNGKENKKAVSLLQLTACFCCGAPEEIRTPGLQVRSLLLYPAELRARREKLCIAIALPCQTFLRKKSIFMQPLLSAVPLSMGPHGRPGPFSHIYAAIGTPPDDADQLPDVIAKAGISP